MKLLLTIFAATIMATTAYSQANPYKYLQKNGVDWWTTYSDSVPLLPEYNLKGNIRSYQLAEYSVEDGFQSSTNSMAANKEVFFNTDGNITAEQYYAPDGFMTWKVTYRDYAKKQVTDYRGFRRRGGIKMIDSAAYNETGILIHESLVDSIKMRYNFNYELQERKDTLVVLAKNKFTRLRYLNGKKIYEYFPYGDRKNEYEWTRYQGDSVLISRYASGRLYEKAVFDKWGHEISRTQYNESNELEQSWRRNYADAFQLQYEEYYYLNDNGQYSRPERTTYNFKEQTLQSIDYKPGNKTFRLKYNDQGDLISLEKPGRSATYTYVYDDRGNWIQRDEFINQKPALRLKRVINYY